MEKFSHPNFEHLPQLVADVDYFVIGEMHGISENADVMCVILKAMVHHCRPVTLAFEWNFTKEEVDVLRAYITNGTSPRKLPTFISDSDGRCVDRHVALLKCCLEINTAQPNTVDIAIFDVLSPDRDEQMADNLSSLSKNDGRLIVVEAGVYHVRPNRNESVMIDYLHYQSKVLTAFMQYENGDVWVEDEAFPVHGSSQQGLGPRTDFDVVISVPHATACSPTQTLTAFEQIYTLPLP